MNEYLPVASTRDINEGEILLVEAGDRLVILFQVGGKFYCIDDVCTHDGGTLSDGEHEGYEIKCPRHGARFDIRTGKALCMPATQDTRTYPIKVDGDAILVRIPGDD
jgi:3-phenylpropionate/trans-cinnamate dioxygenase ferredoxin subunit